MRSAVLSSSYGWATAKTSPLPAAKSVAPTPSTVIGGRPSTSRTNALISSCASVWLPTKPIPRISIVLFSLSVSAILTHEHMFV